MDCKDCKIKKLSAKYKAIVNPPHNVLDDILASNKRLVEWVQRLQEDDDILSERINDYDRDNHNALNDVKRNMKRLEKRLSEVILYGKSHNELYDSKLFRLLRLLRLIP